MIDFNGVEESKGGFGEPPKGTYVLKVVSISYEPTRSRRNGEAYETRGADLVWDVAEGPYKDAFGDRPEWTHSASLNFKGYDGGKPNLGFLKHQLMCISRSNEGFDALAAFNAVIDPSDPHHARAVHAFEGKLFGATITDRHWRKQDGTDGSKKVVSSWWDADEARSGTDKDGNEIPAPDDQYQRGYDAAQSEAARAQAAQPAQAEPAPAVDVYDDDVPF